LARDYSEPPGPALLLGTKFEAAVYKECEEQTLKGSDHFKVFVKKCKGGNFQKKTKKVIELNGFDYCLYGKLDVDFPNKIIDIKTTSNYKGKQHYLSTFQHKLYCYCEQKSLFEYLVAEFDANEKLIDHHIVNYEVDDFKALETEVIERIKEAVAFLSNNHELFELYTSKFSQY